MGKTIKTALCLIAVMLLTGIALLTTFGGADSASAQETGPGGGLAADAPVPGWVRALIAKHAEQCPQITASLLAAQLYVESRFDPTAVSDKGARGMAQFTPETWSRYGLDGDGDGVESAFDAADAIAAQAHYDCVLAQEVKGVPGDSTENMLAAYNAGAGAVIEFGGVPPYPETRGYVKAIRELAAKWAAVVDSVLPAGQGAARAVSAAKTALGTWYRWGGSCSPPYTGQNGCDCSSLTKMAWAAAGVNLPRVTYDQVHAGTAVNSVSQLRPGDLLFSIPGPSGPEHVGMYIGDGEVIEAPHTGARVRITPLSYWTPRIVAMRHIG
ncbi:bifunctional lytic transglycosylase/C40 family peptidase [Streptomyces mexicanus]|jgi:cell wall-associated NlpC family hydrolase|uniref:C40 family peptidase n=1 Tax=Streptomyces mexicanus TaxID=178566 RepID=UPI0031ED81DA